MTTKQARSMLLFHRKMAKAFRSVGKEKEAEATDRRADDCQRVLKRV